DEVAMSFDRASRSVRARRVRRLGALRLDEAPMAVGDAEAAARALAVGIAELGIGVLPWTKEQRALRARATYLRATLGEEWPDLSDAGLAADVEWLAAAVLGKTALSEIGADDLGAALEGLLPYGRRQ